MSSTLERERGSWESTRIQHFAMFILMMIFFKYFLFAFVVQNKNLWRAYKYLSNVRFLENFIRWNASRVCFACIVSRNREINAKHKEKWANENRALQLQLHLFWPKHLLFLEEKERKSMTKVITITTMEIDRDFMSAQLYKRYLPRTRNEFCTVYELSV